MDTRAHDVAELLPSLAEPARRRPRVQYEEPDAATGAHRALKASVLISAARCMFTYLVVPLAVPMISFVRIVEAPVSIGLCLLAIGTCVVSLRRFWIANHRTRWRYAAFIGAALVLLVMALATDVYRLVR